MTEQSQEDRREEILTEFMMDDANASYATISEWMNRYPEYARAILSTSQWNSFLTSVDRKS